MKPQRTSEPRSEAGLTPYSQPPVAHRERNRLPSRLSHAGPGVRKRAGQCPLRLAG